MRAFYPFFFLHLFLLRNARTSIRTCVPSSSSSDCCCCFLWIATTTGPNIVWGRHFLVRFKVYCIYVEKYIFSLKNILLGCVYLSKCKYPTCREHGLARACMDLHGELACMTRSSSVFTIPPIDNRNHHALNNEIYQHTQAPGVQCR